MIYVEAPKIIDVPEDSIGVFLAGSITGAESWQLNLIELIKDLDIVVYNPRRKFFDVKDDSKDKQQIEWEYKMLHKSKIISFWFSSETLAPITLFELGFWSGTDKPLVIGTHSDYKRRNDVVIQMSLIRPGAIIFNNLHDVSMGIRYWTNNFLVKNASERLNFCWD